MKEIELKMFKQSYITQITCTNDRAKQTEKKLTSISCKKTTKRAINRLQKKKHTRCISVMPAYRIQHAVNNKMVYSWA